MVFVMKSRTVMDLVTICFIPSQLLKVKIEFVSINSRDGDTLSSVILSHSSLFVIEKVALSAPASITKSFLLTFSLRNIRVNSFTMKMEILLESTSNKLMVVTHWFTLIVLSALRRSDNENMLSTLNTTAGNPVKKILLKLNLSDHRLSKMVVEVPDSSCLTRSITTCSYPIDQHKVIMKAQVHVSRLPLL
ncbi:hypothetical protein Tco_0365060 [Tanacetum coccineum]